MNHLPSGRRSRVSQPLVAAGRSRAATPFQYGMIVGGLSGYGAFAAERGMVVGLRGRASHTRVLLDFPRYR